MADLSDVSNAIVALLASAFYPNGISQPSAVNVTYKDFPINCPVKVFTGWPESAELDCDLKSNVINISIYPRDEEKVLSLTEADARLQAAAVKTITLTVAGRQVTVAGTVTASRQNVCVFANYKPYVYPTIPTDTPTTIATALAALIAMDIPGTLSSGAVVTLPATVRGIIGRVGGVGSTLQETRRQDRAYQITVWANRFDVRDTAAQIADLVLSGAVAANGQMTAVRLTMPDTTLAIMRYHRSHQDDGVQKQSIYRRDFFYSAEFVTAVSAPATEIVATQTNVAIPDGPTLTVYE